MRAKKPSCVTTGVLLLAAFAASFSGRPAFCQEKAGPRQVINLDGIWEIAEGTMDSVPKRFTHGVPVPGLVDMATPAFAEVGRKCERREAFWYRRTFKVEGAIPAVAILKIYKAKYGTKVFLNGQLIGEHLPCFTPALFDVKKHLKGNGKENELLVRVGADRECLPESMPTGWDFEKYLYIPGIYDSVELTLTGSPHIIRVQTLPEVNESRVRVLVDIGNIKRGDEIATSYTLREARTGKKLSFGRTRPTKPAKHEAMTIGFSISIQSWRLWTPDDPFLYEVEISTAGDSQRVRFGMRSFRFDKETGRAILNGRPYFMRGTNVCIYRFFEDFQRADRPWRKEWVRRLHRKFKSMHWNSIRYCIGFPPEIWYDIADEEGFLIQDEFPIWYLNQWPASLKSDVIAGQYKQWMQERWNHPCVVIWDAQNESVTGETGKAIQAVRHLDLSDRPWENGWAEPQSPNDCVESHPYLFIRTWQGKHSFRLKDIATVSPLPHLRAAQKKHTVPIIINEYAWLWLNRDGSPTCLTRDVYRDLLGPSASIPQLRYTYARYLAALTEFWRCRRKCAAVMHFCGLGYSRPGGLERPVAGATSDHFVDLETLNFEPNFEQYVRDSFAPVGLMIDVWKEQLSPAEQINVPVFVINDLYSDWKGTVNLRVMHGGKIISEQSKSCAVSGLGREILSFKQIVPDKVGEYLLAAELTSEGKEPVRSLRDFKVVPSPQ